ncbi:MAG: YdbH domain-containing protein [Sphingorhabdus sp.]
MATMRLHDALLCRIYTAMTEVAETEVEEVARPRRVKAWYIFAGVALLLILLLLFAWWQRVSIAESFVQDQLEQAGVEATYTIEEIGLRTQRVSNLVIGDPASPDLTLREAEVDISLDFSGAAIQWVRAKGVRLRGRVFPDGRISFGEIDKFLDPESKEPFSLPDFALDLEDASLALATPWGAVGIGLEGYGQLRGQFEGEAALRSRNLAYKGCELRDLSFDGEVKLSAQKPHLAGPLEARAINCPGQDIAVSRLLLDGDLQLNESFDRWVGNIGFKAKDILLAGQQFTSPVGNIDFNGGIERSNFKIALNEAGYRSDPLSIRQIVITGAGRLGVDDAGFSMAMRGDAEIAGARADPLLVAMLDGVTESTRDTPVGPLLAKLGPAARGALASFDAGASFDFAIPARAATKVDIRGLDIATRSGARIRQTGALRLEARRAGWAIATPVQLAMSGGGLPEGRLSLRRTSGSGWAGSLALSPYVSGNARLALSKFDFSGRPGGSWHFGGNAQLSGPLAGGRIQGLRLPLDGSWNGQRLSLYDGCRNIAFDRARMSGVSLGKHSFQLCPDGGPILVTGKAGTRLRTRIPNFAIEGHLGSTPIDLKSTVVRFRLDEGFNASNVEVALGQKDSQTAFSAALLDGRFDRRGLSGRLSGGEGQIANVPLVMSDAVGDWTYRDGAIRLVGALGFVDIEENRRFLPMLVPEIIVDYEGGTITAIGEVAEPTTGTRVAGIDIRHVLDSGEGRALLAIDDLTFSDAFQPELLTELTLGVVANVHGAIYGDATIAWDNSHDGIASTGRFGTNSLDLAAAFGPVRGLQSELVFTDLLSLETASEQIARIALINPGIAALGGQVRYQLLPDQRVQIEGGSWPFAGGELILEPTVWDFGVEKPRNLVIRVKGIEVAKFIGQFDFNNLTASGVFDGVLPMTFDANGGRIIGGELVAREGGGNISYVGELTYEDLSPYANFAFDALRSIDYRGLTIGMNGDLGGEIITVIKFDGVKQGTGTKKNFITRQLANLPIKFNIVIEAQFFELIGSVRSFYDPEFLVLQNLPLLLRQQQEAARKKIEGESASDGGDAAGDKNLPG